MLGERDAASIDLDGRVSRQHLARPAVDRLRIASEMFDVGRRIVWSSLSTEASREERLRVLMQRIYGDELSDAAVSAFVQRGGRDLGELV